ncbi:hypothetical protein A9267_12015 [Shewanella sp. UCD-FRSSP16_17]|uniref:GNAT family N-acetyltransferase n=1 Tax=Shewanella sp. UCD-FRSSP16_17 TaxID=1853256 RepID=UPI0007EEB554|nr:GNAT family N-acetyltransferase [Shewanella sp. UCD-FRSSP16_17]OBT08410.1 hypothetical protein A9267_12015 [Shewanella sp. UCD-FRSSP16_17]
MHSYYMFKASKSDFSSLSSVPLPVRASDSIQGEYYQTTLSEQQQLWSVIKLFYRQHLPYSKPMFKDTVILCCQEKADDKPIANHTNQLQIDNILAAVRIKKIGEVQLVTGLVVKKSARSQGIAHQLMSVIQSNLLESECYVFAIASLTDFYQQHGFIKPHEVDNNINQLFKKHNNQNRPLALLKSS